MALIEDIRRKGYVVAAGSVAVQIKNYSQSVAMCVLGPKNHIVNRVDEILTELRSSVSVIEQALSKKTPG